jgi:hypothetical protein
VTELLTKQSTDWQGIVLAIQHKGIPLQRASLRLGRHKGFMSQVARGEIVEPMFSDGVNILAMAYDVIGDDIKRFSRQQGALKF